MTGKSIRDVQRRRFLRGTGALLASAALPVSANAMSPDAALELATKRRGELLDLLSTLVSVQSLSGETAAEAQALVRQYLGALPYRVEESADRPSQYENHDEFMRPNPPGDGPFINLVGWPEKKVARQFAIFSHIDTHVIADGWESAPLQPKIAGSRMYGLGTSDDKGGIAAMLVAAAALAEAGEVLPVVMSLHGKGGGSRGSLPVFDRMQNQDHRIGAVLYAHPAETGRGLDDIKNEVQGVFDLELRITGWRAPPMEIGSLDSSDWEDGGNALEMCWTALEHLRQTAFAGQMFNLGVMEGGDRMGSVATDAAARFRLKFSASHTWRSLLAAGNASLAEFRDSLSGDNARFELALNEAGRV